jgi:malto-oligosyltrehalose trehalohydrolase
MKRTHDMPFGAQCRSDGSVRFSLWAPAATRVDLCLNGETSCRYLALRPSLDGRFELVTPEAHPGSHYQFLIDRERRVPDPASRFQPLDVHGASEVIDPAAFDWHDENWRGFPWDQSVIYELHTGTFSPAGSFRGIEERLDYLVELGVNTIELMPVADFPGERNWGYDGVLLFAPDSTYGRPEDLKALVQAAHLRGIAVLLDVVYNHFGPEGNYLRVYAPQFFTDRHRTPWGDGNNFDGAQNRAVRDFFIHNALFWLTEYHMDGLRLDAVHSVIDDSPRHILNELASVVRDSLGQQRHIHLVLENDSNQAGYLRRVDGCCPVAYNAQWNDDIHHAMHVLLTGERDGYYADYSDRPLDQLGRCLVSGFAYQGEPSPYRHNQPRGDSSEGLPPSAFVSFLQNHDQIGNRAFGERISQIADARALRAALEILLLAPSPPLLFMGEEFAAGTPFLYFCDFEKQLAEGVRRGRQEEFARFARFSNAAVRARIPDPGAVETFRASRIDWSSLSRPEHADWLRFYRRLLGLRRRLIVPHFQECDGSIRASFRPLGGCGLAVQWQTPHRQCLTLIANLGSESLSGIVFPAAPPIYTSQHLPQELAAHKEFPSWSVGWFLGS